MSSSSSSSSGEGIGFFGLLGILFIGLKLGNVIDWSWWYVLMPIYGPLAVGLVIVSVLYAFAGIIWVVEKIGEKLDRFANS